MFIKRSFCYIIIISISIKIYQLSPIPAKYYQRILFISYTTCWKLPTYTVHFLLHAKNYPCTYTVHFLLHAKRYSRILFISCMLYIPSTVHRILLYTAIYTYYQLCTLPPAYFLLPIVYIKYLPIIIIIHYIYQLSPIPAKYYPRILFISYYLLKITHVYCSFLTTC